MQVIFETPGAHKFAGGTLPPPLPSLPRPVPPLPPFPPKPFPPTPFPPRPFPPLLFGGFPPLLGGGLATGGGTGGLFSVATLLLTVIVPAVQPIPKKGSLAGMLMGMQSINTITSIE